MRYRFFLALMLVVFASPIEAQPAAPSTATCFIERDTAAILRYRSADWRKMHEGGAVEYCSEHSASLNAWLFDAPQKNALGICVAHRRDIKLKRSLFDDLYEPSWDRVDDATDTIVLMLPAEADCPRAGENSYIIVNDVPAGTFLELYRLSTTIQKTPDALYALAPTIPASDGSLAGFQGQLSNPAAAVHLSLHAVSPGKTYGAGRLPDYELMIWDDRSPGEWYELEIARTGARLELLHVGLAVI